MKRTLVLILIVGLAITSITILTAQKDNQPKAPAQYSYKIVKSYPHDVKAYTQGLFFHNGSLYETTGQYGQSSLRKVDLTTGRVLQTTTFERKYFAEGSCVFNNRIYVLTWKEQTCFVFDIANFRQIGTLYYATEGWGLNTDGKYLIMSDGSERLYFMNPDNFAEIRRITVSNNKGVVRYLNELEYINGEIWANVYNEDYIVRIDPANGNVISIVNLQGILPRNLRTATTDVMNGIAYDAENKRILVTGKNWPRLFEITVSE